jgi:hypothetical protein
LHRAGQIGGWGVKVAVNKLNLLIDADRDEYPPGQGVKKTLSDLPLVTISDQRRINRFGGRPDRPFLEAVAHQTVNRHHELIQYPAVEPEPLRRVRMGAQPVAAQEPVRGPSSDDVELSLITEKRLVRSVSAERRQPTVGQGLNRQWTPGSDFLADTMRRLLVSDQLMKLLSFSRTV